MTRDVAGHRIVVDLDGCCGHGRCYDLSPELFESDDAGHTVVVHDVIGDDQLAAARRAVTACPERVIAVDPA
jgi:ferredoxin